MNVAVGAYVVDVLAAVAAPVAVDCGAGGRRYCARKVRQIIVHPVGARMNVEFVNVSIGTDEVHMLAAIGSPIGVESTALCGRDPERDDGEIGGGDVAGIIVLQIDAALVACRQGSAWELVERYPIVDERLGRVLPVVDDARHLAAGVDRDDVLLNGAGLVLRRIGVQLKSKTGVCHDVG